MQIFEIIAGVLGIEPGNVERSIERIEYPQLELVASYRDHACG